jgi:hypothetical protein
VGGHFGGVLANRRHRTRLRSGGGRKGAHHAQERNDRQPGRATHCIDSDGGMRLKSNLPGGEEALAIVKVGLQVFEGG